MWNIPESNDMARPSVTEAERLKLISEGCGPKTVSVMSGHVFLLVQLVRRLLKNDLIGFNPF